MKKQFDYIQDAGHGWVKVPLALIRELGITEKITHFSYYNNGQVYLEEDNDTCTFMNAYHARFGFDPKLRDRIARERRSRVRGYDPFYWGNFLYKTDHNWMQELYDKRKKIVDTQQQA
jgi:hypothetical protein